MHTYDFLKSYVNSKSEADQKQFVFKRPLDEIEWVSLQNTYSIVLPQELQDFYRFSYGAELDEYKILRVEEIRNLLLRMKAVYGESLRVDIVPFAYLMGVGDFIAFDLAVSDEAGFLILDCFHKSRPEEWKPICFGLDNWLKAMVRNNFRAYWL